MQTATEANAPDLWDRAWAKESEAEWRRVALSRVYERILRLLGRDPGAVADVGGGVGTLAAMVKDIGGEPTVLDHSQKALAIALRRGVPGYCCDLNEHWSYPYHVDAILCTEVLEHLHPGPREHVYYLTKFAGRGLFSVPNNRLGPEEEPQHTRKWTAKEFLDELREHFEYARVEVLGPYLLGVVGDLARKPFTLSVCLPARDEEEDIAATLASFRGVADQLVVGVDHRTKDRTREIAAEYADEVFDIDDPTGPDDDGVPSTGVHFAHVRNRCMDRCRGDWIFMTEAHERLGTGEDVLLGLHKVMPPEALVGFVFREGNRQRWAFPWLSRNHPAIRYKRATHNVLDYPAGANCVRLPQITTLHDRVHAKDVERHGQRKVQNRTTLLADFLESGNENSLHYLGAEWREHSGDKAIERFREYLALPTRNGPQRYHTRILLAKELLKRGGDGDAKEAREALLGCAADDWSRTEHWIWLGDLAFEAEQFEEALAWYRYAGTTAGEPPFTLWWIDLSHYAWIPAQRLAMTFARLGRGQDALAWARRVVDLMPDDSPAAALDEARRNVQQLQEATDAPAPHPE
jgi:glycosyltransferase involved in cell wall biosynthesis/2-polyprenyl-3-methyl-5-hydroxy-6-metoxy-1,4-benzoquinol methylase